MRSLAISLHLSARCSHFSSVSKVLRSLRTDRFARVLQVVVCTDLSAMFFFSRREWFVQEQDHKEG